MNNYMISATRPTPLPSDPNWLKKFNNATGDPDKKIQAKLAKDMKMAYWSGVGEIIWAMTICRPHLAYAGVKLLQSNHCLHEHCHYHGLCHTLKYLYVRRDDGIYFWRTQLRMELKEGPLPVVQSGEQDLLLDSVCLDHDANVLHAYTDSDWATCPKT